MSGMPKIQHYVPQFLLRNFGTGKKDQLHVFDKQTGKVFLTNAKNVASESRFYDFNVDNTQLTFEPSLSKIEASAKPVIKKILDADTLKPVSSEERTMLCIFFAVQLTRTRAFKEQIRSLPDALGERLMKWGQTLEQKETLAAYVKPPDENQLKIQMIRMMVEAPEKIGPHFVNKHWLLIATDAKHPFIIGDNPLTMQNTSDFSPYGNLGLANRGIEIYFPLSPTRALAMWCPSLINGIGQAVSTLEDLRSKSAHLLEGLATHAEYIESLWGVILSGHPLQYQNENVANFNSLQVRFAERHVFSSRNEFALPEKMVTEISSVRKGPRFSMR